MQSSRKCTFLACLVCLHAYMHAQEMLSSRKRMFLASLSACILMRCKVLENVRFWWLNLSTRPLGRDGIGRTQSLAGKGLISESCGGWVHY